MRWRGFIAPQFVRDVFLLVRREGLKVMKKDFDGEGGTGREGEGRWFGMCARGWGEDGWTVMQFAGRDTLVWERPG